MTKKDYLKRHLLNILQMHFNDPIEKIHLTLKENNIWPNIRIFFKTNRWIIPERIFLTEFKYEITEQKLFNKLALTQNIEDLKKISNKTLMDIAYLI